MKPRLIVAGIVVLAAVAFVVLRRPQPRERPAASVTDAGVVLVQGGVTRVIAPLAAGEGARNFAWSPDGSWLAFETFDLNGHSPMTTTHVRIARTDGTGLAEVRLPGPNQRFSTYLERWEAPGTLRIRATLLESPDDLFFRYHCDTASFEGPLRE